MSRYDDYGGGGRGIQSVSIVSVEDAKLSNETDSKNVNALPRFLPVPPAREPLMISTTLQREVGVASGSKREITSSPRNVMGLLRDVCRGKNVTMRRRKTGLRLILVGRIDA